MVGGRFFFLVRSQTILQLYCASVAGLVLPVGEFKNVGSLSFRLVTHGEYALVCVCVRVVIGPLRPESERSRAHWWLVAHDRDPPPPSLSLSYGEIVFRFFVRSVRLGWRTRTFQKSLKFKLHESLKVRGGLRVCSPPRRLNCLFCGAAEFHQRTNQLLVELQRVFFMFKKK